MRARISIGRELYPTRGFGLFTRGGGLGTSVDDSRNRYFREFDLMLWWPIVLHLSWTSKRPG